MKKSALAQQKINPSASRLRFDESNIEVTNHPDLKDYGFFSIPEGKTPFPRHADPVEAYDLTKRLYEILIEANQKLGVDLTSQKSFEFIHKDFYAAAAEIEKDKRRMDFLRKRKQFYKSEFLITRQRRLNAELHPPGPSVGNNWRLDEESENPSKRLSQESQTRTSTNVGRHRMAPSLIPIEEVIDGVMKGSSHIKFASKYIKEN